MYQSPVGPIDAYAPAPPSPGPWLPSATCEPPSTSTSPLSFPSEPRPPGEAAPPPLRWQTWQTTVDAAAACQPVGSEHMHAITYAVAVGLTVVVLLVLLCPPFVAKPRTSRFEAPEPNPFRVFAWGAVAAAVAAVLPPLIRYRAAVGAAK